MNIETVERGVFAQEEIQGCGMSTTLEKNVSFSMKDIGPLIEEMVEQGDIFRLTVSGTSMMPFLRNNRDEVVFAPLEGRTLKRGDILLYKRREGTYVMHRLYRIEKDGTYTFIGDHQYKVEEGIRREQIKAYVQYAFRDSKKIDCEKGFLRDVMTDYMVFRVNLPGVAYWGMMGIEAIRKVFKGAKD